MEGNRAQPPEPDPVIEAYKKDVDRTLLRENLRLTPLERLRNLQSHYELAEQVRSAGRKLRDQVGYDPPPESP